jgi:hypothetical protein
MLLFSPRNHGGMRASWNQGQQLSFGQKWNPWCSDIPYITLTHHPLLYNEKEKETVTYNIDDFFESFVQVKLRTISIKYDLCIMKDNILRFGPSSLETLSLNALRNSIKLCESDRLFHLSIALGTNDQIKFICFTMSLERLVMDILPFELPPPPPSWNFSCFVFC